MHQRDEFWLKGNAKSLGSFDAMFKLSNAEPLLAEETTYFLSAPQVPINFEFGVHDFYVIDSICGLRYRIDI